MNQEDEKLLLGKDVQRIVTRWAKKYTRKYHDYEDARQTALLHAVRYLRDKRDVPRDQTFLFQLNDYVRAVIGDPNRKRVKYIQSHQRELYGDSPLLARDYTKKDELSLTVREAMNMLPEHMRLAVKYVFFYDMSDNEAGRACGVTAQTIRNRIAAASRVLKPAIMGERVRDPHFRNPPANTLPSLSISESLKRRIPDKKCKADGCDEPGATRGLCNKHYRRWLTHGDPLAMAFERWSDL